MKQACLLLALAACAADPDPIHYTGETKRFVVDAITVPTSNAAAREHGLDINGDGRIDNQLGMVTGTLASFGDITKHSDDMIAAGVIASSLELVADDFENDDTVALRYIGIAGETSELVGGSLDDGKFVTDHAGAATIHLPVFVDADPLVLELRKLRVELSPDGRGGFDATIAGGIVRSEAVAAAFSGIEQMLAARPRDHFLFFRVLDSNKDFLLTQEEFEKNSLTESLLAPDLTRDGQHLLSIGFRIHLKPCAQGSCIDAPPVNTCFDRVRDGDETDVDCGGSCGPCAGGLSCAVATDCDSNACNAGACAIPTCSDGVHDGFETDVDCGSECGGCAAGKTCFSDVDCISGQCGAPCSGTFCGNELDTCR